MHAQRTSCQSHPDHRNGLLPRRAHWGPDLAPATAVRGRCASKTSHADAQPKSWYVADGSVSANLPSWPWAAVLRVADVRSPTPRPAAWPPAKRSHVGQVRSLATDRSRAVGCGQGQRRRRSSPYQNESPCRIDPIVQTTIEHTNSAAEVRAPRPWHRNQITAATTAPSTAPQMPRTMTASRSTAGSG